VIEHPGVFSFRLDVHGGGDVAMQRLYDDRSDLELIGTLSRQAQG
jgi:hypothetical protein